MYICCSIYGTLHIHGSGGNINEQNYGSRIAHCGTCNLPWISGGSFWDNPRGDSYELVCTHETVRQDKDASGYARRWYRENRLVDYNKERRQRARDMKRIAKVEGITYEEAYEKLMRDKKPEIQLP